MPSPEILYAQQDFSLIPPLNLVVPVIAGDVVPTPSNVGLIYRNSSSGVLRYVRDANTVITVLLSGQVADADIASGAAISLSKLATDPLARGNHTGTQPASTISDLGATVRAVRLDEFAVPTSALNAGGQRITNMAAATVGNEAPTLQQVQNLVSAARSNQDYKDSVRVAVGTNVSLSAPGSTLDGVALADGDRVLLYGQTAAAENGIYVLTGATPVLTRAGDADSDAEVTSGMTVPVTEGTRADTMAILTTDGAITLGTTALSFTFLSVPTAYVAGDGIQINGNVISLLTVDIARGGTGATTVEAARDNLGVARRGFVATLPSIGVGGTVNVVHGLGSVDVVVEVYRIADGATVRISTARVDANTVSVSADIGVNANTLRIVILPVA